MKIKPLEWVPAECGGGVECQTAFGLFEIRQWYNGEWVFDNYLGILGSVARPTLESAKAYAQEGVDKLLALHLEHGY